jgi:cytochrome b pre-mRNA-processing protein 3
MIMSLFRKDPALEAGEALYAAAVQQARATPLYADYGVPDTVEGRFEMVVIHVYLVLRCLKDYAPETRKTGQKLFDAMFQNMDDSLRELGVGDLSVGKKIRKMAENFYGRVASYEKALTKMAGDEDLAKSLGRNVYGDEDAVGALALARYVQKASLFIEAQPAARIAGGIVQFPDMEKAQ